ncbi:MAG: hypothetical protein PVF70_11560 [Anaerolineales bacterium]
MFIAIHLGRLLEAGPEACPGIAEEVDADEALMREMPLDGDGGAGVTGNHGIGYQRVVIHTATSS